MPSTLGVFPNYVGDGVAGSAAARLHFCSDHRHVVQSSSRIGPRSTAVAIPQLAVGSTFSFGREPPLVGGREHRVRARPQDAKTRIQWQPRPPIPRHSPRGSRRPCRLGLATAGPRHVGFSERLLAGRRQPVRHRAQHVSAAAGLPQAPAGDRTGPLPRLHRSRMAARGARSSLALLRTSPSPLRVQGPTHLDEADPDRRHAWGRLDLCFTRRGRMVHRPGFHTFVYPKVPTRGTPEGRGSSVVAGPRYDLTTKGQHIGGRIGRDLARGRGGADPEGVRRPGRAALRRQPRGYRHAAEPRLLLRRGPPLE